MKNYTTKYRKHEALIFTTPKPGLTIIPWTEFLF